MLRIYCGAELQNNWTQSVTRVFFGRLWVALKRACFCGRVALKRTDRLFTADVENDAPSLSRMHACSCALH